ncbi:MAG: PEP-CTERM sorting domain-containing protein [Armatimonadetes bacterium]|nr:PEP-CTERM sorting domain-containing protein [Armatimonadota bacterium]
MKTKFIVAIAGVALWAVAPAQILDDFEDGTMAEYTQVGGVDNATLVAGAAHDGLLGAMFVGAGGPTFYYDLARVTSAGFQYRAYVRHPSGGATGRFYLGVNASAAGTWTAVVGDNVGGQIILQENAGYGFANRATAAFLPARDTWYQLELDWDAAGNMTVRIYDEPGTTVLAATAPFATGLVGSGGLAMRGFNSWQADTIYVVPEPATMFILGAGLLALGARRRRK